MAKRFCDTDLWGKSWFQELTLKEKVLTKYLYENCDCAGVWERNFRLASFIIGETVTIEDVNKINEKKEQFEILPNGDIFIINFITFQYGRLSENCKPHISIIEKLKKHKLYERVCKPLTNPLERVCKPLTNPLERVCKPLTNPLERVSYTLEEKEKEKEKEIEKEEEKEKEKEKEENFSSLQNNKQKDVCCSVDIEECFKIYRENCKNLLPLSYERRSRIILDELNSFLSEIDYNFDYFRSLCIKANELRKIVENRIDFRSMIRNHIGIMNGKYAVQSAKRGVTKDMIAQAIAKAREKEAQSG